jgi:zinc/manganese transport system permease protein
VWSFDFAFYLSFAIVVTSSVTTAGVLLVFSLLIVPAVVGSIFSDRLPVVLLIAWSAGIAACAVGLAGSYALDLPTGAAMVAAQAGCLLLAGFAKVLLFVAIEQRRRNLRIAIDALVTAVLIALLVSSAWLMIVPTGDQPILAGLGSARRGFWALANATPMKAPHAIRYASQVERLMRRRGALRERRVGTAHRRTRRPSTR